MIHRAKQHPVKEFLNRYPQVIAYALVIFVFFFSLWLDNQNAKADERKRCEASVDTRNVDRDQTQRIYFLAMSFVPKDLSALSPTERKRVKAYVEQVSDFREESFKTIKPSPLCAPYVDDINVTPEEWEKAHPPNPLSATKENR